VNYSLYIDQAQITRAVLAELDWSSQDLVDKRQNLIFHGAAMPKSQHQIPGRVCATCAHRPERTG
jgi:hypothetical protein